jgi:hypothetical protein
LQEHGCPRNRFLQYIFKRVFLCAVGVAFLDRHGAGVEGHPLPRGVPDRRSYAVGKHWVTKIKAVAEKGEKRKVRILKHLRSDEAKAAEEIKAMKAQERGKKGQGRNARKSLKNAIPAAVGGQDEEEDPADAFS